MGWHHKYLVEIFLIHVETYMYSGKKKTLMLTIIHLSIMNAVYEWRQGRDRRI